MKTITLEPPLYWVVEEEATGPVLGTGWFVYADPPYYKGKSVRVRLGERAYEVGLLRKSKERFAREVDVEPIELRDWRGPNADHQKEEEGSPADTGDTGVTEETE